MPITINTIDAKYGIDRVPGGFSIQTRQSEISIDRQDIKLNISHEWPQLRIDQSACFSESGLKNNLDLMVSISSQGKQMAEEFTTRKSSTGDSLGRINEMDLVTAISQKPDDKHEFGMVTMPQSRPVIDFVGARLDIDFDTGVDGAHNGVKFDVKQGEVELNYTPTKIQIYMLEYGKVKIDYIPGGKLDTYA